MAQQWSMTWRIRVGYRTTRSLPSASHCCCFPPPNSGSPEIVPISRPGTAPHATATVVYQSATWSTNDGGSTWIPLDYPTSHPLSTYHAPAGLSDLDTSRAKYGKNEFIIPDPEFITLFLEQCTSPFFVFQCVCIGLWCLDEYWYYSIFTLVMIMVFEGTMVLQRQRSPLLEILRFPLMEGWPAHLNSQEHLQ